MQDHAGEVKYVTLAGEGDFVEECDAYVEFGTLKGVLGALKMENLTIKEKTFTVGKKIQPLPNIHFSRPKTNSCFSG